MTGGPPSSLLLVVRDSAVANATGLRTVTNKTSKIALPTTVDRAFAKPCVPTLPTAGFEFPVWRLTILRNVSLVANASGISKPHTIVGLLLLLAHWLNLYRKRL